MLPAPGDCTEAARNTAGKRSRGVEISHRLVVGVGAHHICAAAHSGCETVGQTDLIFPRKNLFVVLNEAIVVVLHGVGRISKDEVAFLRFVDRIREVSRDEFRFPQCRRDSREVVGVEHYCIF